MRTFLLREQLDEYQQLLATRRANLVNDKPDVEGAIEDVSESVVERAQLREERECCASAEKAALQAANALVDARSRRRAWRGAHEQELRQGESAAILEVKSRARALVRVGRNA